MVYHPRNGHGWGMTDLITRDRDDAGISADGPVEIDCRRCQRSMNRGDHRDRCRAAHIKRPGQRVIVDDVGSPHAAVGPNNMAEFRQGGTQRGGFRGPHPGDAANGAFAVGGNSQKHLMPGGNKSAGEDVHHPLDSAVSRRRNGNPRSCY